MLSTLLENVVDGTLMERKRIVVSSWARKKGNHINCRNIGTSGNIFYVHL